MTYRPTWAQIDLGAIEYNYKSIKSHLAKDTMIMSIVKANAYGHGSKRVSQKLQELGVDYLGVATLDEAISLRNNDITIPILILGCVFANEVKYAVDNDITITLCNDEVLEAASKIDKKVKVHIKVDTGMGRIGVWHKHAIDFVEKVNNHANIDIEGIFTHFSIAARDKIFTQTQIDDFNNVLNQLEDVGIDISIKHAANSIALVDWKDAQFNMVRPGLIMFGMYPKKDFPNIIKLKPALSLKTKVAFVKNVEPGMSISYGRTYIAQQNTQIATLPIGYADGYGRILSGKSKVLIKGKKYPVVGIVTMDQIMIDLGPNSNVKVGDEVVLIGKQQFQEIKIGDLAKQAGTIPYEIVTGITSRVPRKYV